MKGEEGKGSCNDDRREKKGYVKELLFGNGKSCFDVMSYCWDICGSQRRHFQKDARWNFL
jgi:hypothetical protein